MAERVGSLSESVDCIGFKVQQGSEQRVQN